MAIKLIVSDMDGTLLNEHLKVTDQVARAIFAAQDAGIEFAIATGRTLESGYSFIQDKGIVSPFIELNGARLFDEEGKIHFTREIEPVDLKEIIQMIQFYEVQHEVITPNGSYSSNSAAEQIEAYKGIFRDINPTINEKDLHQYVINYMNNFKVNRVNDLNFLVDEDTQVLKVLFNAHENPEIFQEIEQEIAQKTANLIVTSASSFNLEINHQLANKGQAVADFAKMRGYQAHEVITIGDNINDLTMLEWAEHSYAVDNAHLRAKKAATYLAPSHVDDAVAQIIEKVLIGDDLNFHLE